MNITCWDYLTLLLPLKEKGTYLLFYAVKGDNFYFSLSLDNKLVIFEYFIAAVKPYFNNIM